MTAKKESKSGGLIWLTPESKSSFHDVTLLSAPLLQKAIVNCAELPQESESSHKRTDCTENLPLPKPEITTVRVLKFGFSNKDEGGVPWRWDPFKDCRGLSLAAALSHLLSSVFPCIEWIRSYQLSYLKGDIVAGLSVGFMLIPQGMAYARIAGLPSVYGLYTGLVPSLVYSVFGSSRQMALGPTSLVSLLVAEAVRKFVDVEVVNEGDPLLERYLGLTLLLALMVGVVQIFGGIVRLGWTVRFLSHAVVSGFSSGAAIIIGLTQMRYLLGYRYPRSDKMHIMVKDILMNLEKIDYPSFVMGGTAVAFLLVMKHFGKTYKRLRVMRTLGPILTVTIGILFIRFTGNPWNVRNEATNRSTRPPH